MVLVSLSGLVLIFYLQKRLFSGLLTLDGGALACYLAYWYGVP